MTTTSCTKNPMIWPSSVNRSPSSGFNIGVTKCVLFSSFEKPVALAYYNSPRMAKSLDILYRKAIGEKNFILINAFKVERIRSHIHFIKRCLREEMIPVGFIVQDKLKDTLSEADTSQLRNRQSKQWMKLAVNTLYTKLSKLLVPMVYNYSE